VPALLRGREWLINKDHLHKLIDLGLVEMREDVPNLQTPVEKQPGRSIDVNDPIHCCITVKKMTGGPGTPPRRLKSAGLTPMTIRITYKKRSSIRRTRTPCE
jgi:hypothetical protein